MVWCEGTEEGLKIFRWYYTQENNKKPRQTTSLIIRPILSQTSSCVCIYLTLHQPTCPSPNPAPCALASFFPSPHLGPQGFAHLAQQLILIEKCSRLLPCSEEVRFDLLVQPSPPRLASSCVEKKEEVDVRMDSRRDCEGRRRARRIRGRESSMGGGRASERRMLQTSTDG